MKLKVVRASTVAMSLDMLLPGQLAYLNQYFEVVAVSGQDEHLLKVNQREKVRTVSIEMQRRISPWKDLISLIKLYKFFKKERPEIVHSITPKAGLLCMVASYFAGVPIRIHTFTGLIFPTRTGLLRYLLLNMDRLLCFLATNIYPEGEGVKKDLISNNVTNKSLKIIANGNVNGINLSHYNKSHFNEFERNAFRINLNITPKDFVFVFVGRLVSEKGINELVNAFASLNRVYPQTKLLLVGPLEEKLDPLKRETIQTIEQNSNIITVGFQKDVRPFFSISDALVFPSYREGFPNVVIQAGAMGLPSIVTNINGCNEIIEHGKNGLIVPPKDPLNLEAAMKLLLNDYQQKAQMAALSRDMIIERFDQEYVWQELLKEYKFLTADRDKRKEAYKYVS